MKTRQLTVNALFLAIIVLLSIVPQVGLIQIGHISITIMHIPVIIAGIVLGPRSAIMGGIAFGLGSLYAALTRAVTPIDILFTNPLVSVLPRILFGVSIALVYPTLKKVFKNDTGVYALTAGFTTAIHTILVFAALYFAMTGSTNADLLAATASGLLGFLIAGISVNVLVEILVAVLIVPPVVSVLKKYIVQ